MITIKTNNRPRPVIYGFELSAKERAEYDFLDDIDCCQFFRYKGYVYHLSDFMRIGKNNTDLAGWHGYHSDSFFSGVLVKLSDDGEAVTVGTYYS